MAIIFDADEFVLKKRKEQLIDDLEDLDDMPEIQTISEGRPKKEKKKKKSVSEQIEDETSTTDWLATVESFKMEPVKKISKRSPQDIFKFYDGGKHRKKKKKKKDGEPTDWNKEFENESNMIANLMDDQNRFVDALQKKFDVIESTKASSRGVGKFTTDLIESINSGRKLSLDLIKERAALKKTAADLSMKERKEFFSSKGLDDTDIGLASSEMLKKLINESTASIPDEDIGVSDGGLEEMFNELSDDIGVSEDDAELDSYLKYENSNITIYVCISEADENGTKYFVAKDDNDNIINDYPLPEMTDLRINHSTNMASDIYSRKYPIIWI